ncbi:MAG TPA: hypothetical protein VEA78_12860 [Acidimicrobiales bacterium]|nr:hypothetical protein [Acidimicrobiales bacterium]
MTITVVRRHADPDEPVELLDDDRWDDAIPVTRTPRRRRWPEALLAVAVLAVVVMIGAAGSDGEDDATDMPTTSTTERRRTTTTRPRTTTTTWPTAVVGSGPVLGADAGGTGTAIVVHEQDGTIAVLDLDTGDLCRTEDTRGSYLPWQQTPLQHAASMQSRSGQALLVDSSCRASRTFTDGTGWVIAASPASTWVMQDGATTRLVERSSADGAVLREHVLPSYGSTVAGDRALVVTIAGEMVAFEQGSDRVIELGSGQPLALAGGRLIAIRCAGLACGIVAIDLDSRQARPLALPLPAAWEPAALSPDGRWFFFSAPDGDLGRQPRLADLETGRITEVRGGPCSFTADSTWLLCLRPSVAEAVRLADGQLVDLSDHFDGIQGFATLRTG